MDIMDSTDTPTGGLDGSTASSYSSSALPLSVDQRDAFASPTNRTTVGGNEPTSSSSFGFSTGGSAFDRLDATPVVNDDSYNSMPTSTDDVMMPHVEFASHPSIAGGNTAVDTSSPSHLTQQARAKANSAMETAKDKAADARTKAADMTHDAKAKAADLTDSAKAKAAELKDSAKSTAAHLQDKVEDTAESIKEKLEHGAEKVKEEGKHLLSFAKSSLHSAERTVEDKYDHVKDDISARRAETQAAKNSASNQAATAPLVKSTATAESTDTHPDASTMRDRDSHAPLSAWASHGNEIPTKASETHMTDAHQRALRAGEEAHARAVATHSGDDKDVTANPIQGWSMLQKVHDTIEDGAEVIKEKVDGILEKTVRSDSTHHMSAAKLDDIPTLIDTSNNKNTDMVRAKYHPSAERTVSGHNQDE